LVAKLITLVELDGLLGFAIAPNTNLTNLANLTNPNNDKVH